MAALSSARSNNPCCVWWARNGATACWGLPVLDCGGVPVIAVLFQEERAQKEEYVFFINVLLMWSVTHYQKLKDHQVVVKASRSAPSEHTSVRSREETWFVFGVIRWEGQPAHKLELALAWHWRVRWTENKVLSFPLQLFLGFWLWGQFTQNLCPVGWVELKHSSAYNLHYKRLWSG